MGKSLYSLQQLHTFGLHANCLGIHQFSNITELTTLLSKLRSSSFLVLGGGSNSVFIDDYDGHIIVNNIKGVEYSQTNDKHLLKVGAGEKWHDLVTYCVDNDLGGMENLALIPGSVGAAPIQNIGAYGVEIERFIERVEFWDTQNKKLSSFTKEECMFAYRDSVFKQQNLNHRIITNVYFSLPKNYSKELSYGPLQTLKQPSIRDVYERVIEIRKSKLPDVSKLGNAGSFFKNPVVTREHFVDLTKRYTDIPSFEQTDGRVKIPAAWLIDTLGFKGKLMGKVECYRNQPLVLVNTGNALGNDVLEFAREIQTKVKAHFEIILENEVRLIGKQGLIAL